LISESLLFYAPSHERGLSSAREQKMRTKGKERYPLYGRISRHHTKEIKRSTGDHLPLKMSGLKFESPRAANNRHGSSAARP